MSHPVRASNEADSFPATPLGQITPHERKCRPALIGDRGIVLGILNSTASGLAQLAIRVSDNEIALLCGDWRCIHQIAEDLRGEEIEVLESEGSGYGCHSVHSVRQDTFTNEFANDQFVNDQREDL